VFIEQTHLDAYDRRH